jgi:hypothetical protein
VGPGWRAARRRRRVDALALASERTELFELCNPVQRPRRTIGVGAAQEENIVSQFKRLILALSPGEYRQLVDIAHHEVREPEQQASYFIRHALKTATTQKSNEEVSHVTDSG